MAGLPFDQETGYIEKISTNVNKIYRVFEPKSTYVVLAPKAYK